MNDESLIIFRREVIKTMVLMLWSSIETVLSHSYISVVFLLMYGTMWSLNIKFDTGLFTLLSVLLTYTRQSSINYFNFAIRDLVNYIAAQKRIRVRLTFGFLFFYLKIFFIEIFVT